VARSVAFGSYGSRHGGRYLEIDGLDSIVKSLQGGINELHRLMRDIMRGEVGEAMLAYMLPQVPRGRVRTTGVSPMWTRTRIWDMGESGGVEIGYKGEAVLNPGVQGARFQLGTWIESGTRSHMVMPKKGSVMKFTHDGRLYVSRGHAVKGIKKRLIALQTLQSQEWRVLVAMETRINNYFKPAGVAA